MQQFRYAVGQQLHGIPADVAGTELQRIEEQRGGLRAADVVDESRPEAAPLHPVFEWQDEVAAEKYREHQARQVIRSVRVVRSPDLPQATPRKPVVAFVSVTDQEGQRSYRSMARVLGDEEMRQQMVDEALRQLSGLQKRYSHLKELTGVFEAINEVAKETLAAV
jgi:2-methylcitrate dehydratase PrpD